VPERAPPHGEGSQIENPSHGRPNPQKGKARNPPTTEKRTQEKKKGKWGRGTYSNSEGLVYLPPRWKSVSTSPSKGRRTTMSAKCRKQLGWCQPNLPEGNHQNKSSNTHTRASKKKTKPHNNKKTEKERKKGKKKKKKDNARKNNKKHPPKKHPQESKKKTNTQNHTKPHTHTPGGKTHTKTHHHKKKHPAPPHSICCIKKKDYKTLGTGEEGKVDDTVIIAPVSILLAPAVRTRHTAGLISHCKKRKGRRQDTP